MKTHKKLSVILLMVCSLYSGINWAHGHGGGGHSGFGGGYHGHSGFGGGYHGHSGFGGGYHGHSGFGSGYRGHSSFGFYFGAPFFSYPYYSYPYQYPYFYPPAVVTVPSTPPVYIQQSPPATQQYPSGYWYYCNNPEGYYPYIKECPNGWQQVEPTPPAPR